MVFLLLCCTNKSIAQYRSEGRFNRNLKGSAVTIYGDLSFFYVALQASVNLEGRIYHNKKTKLYARVGYGAAIVMELGDGSGVISGLTLLRGNENNHFEINAGVFLAKPGDFNSNVLPILDFGYRYQKPSGGFLFRAKAGIWGVGIGVGYAF